MKKKEEQGRDIFADLEREMDEIDKQYRSIYPELYRNTSHSNSFDISGDEPYDTPRMVLHDSEVKGGYQSSETYKRQNETKYHFANQDDLQAYMLQTHYGMIAANDEWDDAILNNPIENTALSDDEISDEYLFLQILSRVVSAPIDDVAASTIRLEQNNSGSAVGEFLPLYTCFSCGTSRERLRQLGQIEIKTDDRVEVEMLELLREAVNNTIHIIEEAENLQAAGYKNKQETLQAAAKNAKLLMDKLRRRASI